MLVYLIGYMGSGKTTTGKRLAKRLGYQFIDLDDMIERKYKIEVREFFQKYDEKSFRKIEHDTLLQTFQLADAVIAAGGGTPCYYNNMELINQNGISVYIEMSNLSLFHRLYNSKRQRPLLEGKTPDELKHYIQAHLEKRLPYYSQALITAKGENFNLDELLEKINNFKH
jgi:shikimate kinase